MKVCRRSFQLRVDFHFARTRSSARLPAVRPFVCRRLAGRQTIPPRETLRQKVDVLLARILSTAFMCTRRRLSTLTSFDKRRTRMMLAPVVIYALEYVDTKVHRSSLLIRERSMSKARAYCVCERVQSTFMKFILKFL